MGFLTLERRERSAAAYRQDNRPRIEGTNRQGGFMLKGFGQFLMRGNVVDLAVAVIIGAAFGAIVTALVKDLITPLVAAIVGKPDFSAIAFTVNNSRFGIGDFINAVVSFILVAAAVYFFVIVPMNAVTVRTKKPATAEPALRECPECLSEVPAAARRCKFCTAVLSAPAAI
jgi:large conductance mechanosensitive channel